MIDKPLHPAQRQHPTLPINVSVTACWFELPHGEAISRYPYRITNAKDENPKVHYLKFIGPHHPGQLPEDVSTPGDIYIVSTPGDEACYARTSVGWWWWNPLPQLRTQLEGALLYHPSCHPRHLKYLWSDGVVVGWYSLTDIDEARHNMTNKGLLDPNDTSIGCAQKVVKALLAHHNAKRPREQEDASQASEMQRPAKKSNTDSIGASASVPVPLPPVSPPHPEKAPFTAAARSDTETDASTEWQAERECLLKKISDLNSELEKLRNDTPTDESSLSNRILGIFAESMLDPKTLKILGLELNNARAETERLKLKMERDTRAAERSQQQYENQLADARRTIEKEASLRNASLRNASNAAEEISRLKTSNVELHKQNVLLNERIAQIRAVCNHPY